MNNANARPILIIFAWTVDPIVPTTVYYLGKYLLQLSQKRTQKRTWIYVLLKKDNVKTIVQFLFFPRQVVCETLECGGRAKIRHLVVIISIRKLKKKEATHVKTSFRTYCRHVLDYFKRFRSAIKEHTIVINSQKKSSFYRCKNYFESSILNNNSLLLQCKVPTTQGKEDR